MFSLSLHLHISRTDFLNKTSQWAVTREHYEFQSEGGHHLTFKPRISTQCIHHQSFLTLSCHSVESCSLGENSKTRTCLNKCSMNLNVWKHYSCCYYLSQKQYSERCGIKLQAASCCPAIWTSCSFEKYVFETIDQKPDVQTEQDSNSEYPEIVFCIWSNIMKVWRPVNQVASKDTW